MKHQIVCAVGFGVNLQTFEIIGQNFVAMPELLLGEF
jgi:hypothetical protein